MDGGETMLIGYDPTTGIAAVDTLTTVIAVIFGIVFVGGSLICALYLVGLLIRSLFYSFDTAHEGDWIPDKIGTWLGDRIDRILEPDQYSDMTADEIYEHLRTIEERKRAS